MYASSSFLCEQIRFSTYHSSGNRTSSCRHQTRAYRRLQLTHLEQKAVIPVGDESLCLCAPGPFRSQGCFNGHRNISWEDVHFRACRDLVGAAFLPVEHRHRLPALIVHHAVDHRSRHVGLSPLELPHALRHASPVLTDADGHGDEGAEDGCVLPYPFESGGVRHGAFPLEVLSLETALPRVRTDRKFLHQPSEVCHRPRCGSTPG